MERNSAIDPGIQAASEFGALTHHDEVWLVDGRGYITECGARMSYGEIWLVESHDRTTAVVFADRREAPDYEFQMKKATKSIAGQRQMLARIEHSNEV
jgi:hypothetical protein